MATVLRAVDMSCCRSENENVIFAVLFSMKCSPVPVNDISADSRVVCMNSRIPQTPVRRNIVRAIKTPIRIEICIASQTDGVVCTPDVFFAVCFIACLLFVIIQ